MDQRIAKLENETEANIRQALIKTKVKTAEFPQRPGFTTLGREVVLWTNYLKLDCKDDLDLYHYSLEVLPEGHTREPVGKKLRRIVELFLKEHMTSPEVALATDYKTNLLSTKNINVVDAGYVVLHRMEGADEPEPNDKRYRVKVQLVKTLKISSLIDHLTSSSASTLFESKEETIQALNIIFGQHPKSSSTTMTARSNRHFQRNALPQDRHSLGAGLEVIRGYIVSVRAATARILVNVQVKNAAFYQEGPLESIMLAWSPLHETRKRQLAKFLKDLSIDRMHFRRKDKAGQRLPSVKKICGLASKDDGYKMTRRPRVPEFGANAQQVQFWMEAQAQSKKSAKAGPEPPQGGYVTVAEFFRRSECYPSEALTCQIHKANNLTAHNLTLKHPNLPVINVGDQGNPVYLPAEVCQVVPGQVTRAKLSAAQTQQMIKFAVRKPALNAQSIVTKGVQILGFGPPVNSTLVRSLRLISYKCCIN